MGIEITSVDGDGEPFVWLIWNDGDYYGPDLVTAFPSEDEAVSWLLHRLSISKYYGPGKGRSSYFIEAIRPGGRTVTHNDLLWEDG